MPAFRIFVLHPSRSARVKTKYVHVQTRRLVRGSIAPWHPANYFASHPLTTRRLVGPAGQFPLPRGLAGTADGLPSGVGKRACIAGGLVRTGCRPLFPHRPPLLLSSTRRRAFAGLGMRRRREHHECEKGHGNQNRGFQRLLLYYLLTWFSSDVKRSASQPRQRRSHPEGRRRTYRAFQAIAAPRTNIANATIAESYILPPTDSRRAGSASSDGGA